MSPKGSERTSLVLSPSQVGIGKPAPRHCMQTPPSVPQPQVSALPPSAPAVSPLPLSRSAQAPPGASLAPSPCGRCGRSPPKPSPYNHNSVCPAGPHGLSTRPPDLPAASLPRRVTRVRLDSRTLLPVVLHLRSPPDPPETWISTWSGGRAPSPLPPPALRSAALPSPRPALAGLGFPPP